MKDSSQVGSLGGRDDVVEVQVPSTGDQRSPFRELARRVAFATALVLVVSLVTWIERDGYTDSADGTVSFLDAVYYSTVSVTTTGYGDVVPVTDSARLTTTLLVTPARVIFLVLLVGTSVELIASATRDRIRRNRWRNKVRDHVVICGFGVKGRAALESLDQHDFDQSRIVVIDGDATAVEKATLLGYAAVRGDITSNSVLRSAHVGRAATVVIAPDRDDTAVLATLSVRAMNSRARVVAAVRELENAPLLRQSGADAVLASSGSTGRMLGIGVYAPHAVNVIEEILDVGRGFDLAEREVKAGEEGPLSGIRRTDDALVVAIFRGDKLIARVPGGNHVLEVGDRVVTLAGPRA